MPRRFGSDDRAFIGIVTWIILGATLYVWASGFGAQSTEPARTMSITSGGVIEDGVKTYFVASATPSMTYADLTFTLDGSILAHGDGDDDCTPVERTYAVCRSSSAVGPHDDVLAGDSLSLGGTRSGQTLRILDAHANSVIMTVTVG